MAGFEICWLPAPPGEIGLAPMPGRSGALAAELAEIRAAGPDLVVSLSEDGEGPPELRARLAEAGLEVAHYPIPDFGVPGEDGRAWRTLSARARAVLSRGGRVLVHCMGGRGRSGMVALRLLVERGEAPAPALARLRQARPGAVETPAQLAWASAPARDGAEPFSPLARSRISQAKESAMPQTIYAVGDIHGHLDKLEEIHRRIEADAGGTPHLVVHLGDLVDRGPDSRGVIEHLRTGIAEGRPWVVLKGNHDRMMERFLESGARDDRLRPDWTWLHPSLGAGETLASYGIDTSTLSPLEILEAARDVVPEEHVSFLAGLPDRFETDQIFFCHAGILPGVPLDAQTEDDLLWIRRPFLDHPGPHPKLIVHGHTPVRHVTHAGCRINLDTGCAYGGPLSAVVFEGDEVFELTEQGRRRLTPEG